MITIDNVRLPEDVERGVQGGPMFNTIVVNTEGGGTDTNQNWQYPLFLGDVGYGIQDVDDFQDVIAFFYARRGRARGFLYKDWSDYTFTASTLGTGDDVETDFQVVKIYSDTILPFSRKLTRPIESSMTVYANGTPISDANWSLVSGGIVRIPVPPVGGVVITATGEFDIPVHFSNDRLNVVLETFMAGTIPSIGIIEVRE